MAQQRDLQKERWWRRAVAKQARSRETIRAFCQREGLAETAFHFWRRELARRDQQAAALTSGPARPVPLADQKLTRPDAARGAAGLASASKSSPASAPRRSNRSAAAQQQPAMHRLAPLTILAHGQFGRAAPLELVFPNGATLRMGPDAPWELVAKLLAACGLAAPREVSPC